MPQESNESPLIPDDLKKMSSELTVDGVTYELRNLTAPRAARGVQVFVKGKKRVFLGNITLLEDGQWRAFFKGKNEYTDSHVEAIRLVVKMSKSKDNRITRSTQEGRDILGALEEVLRDKWKR